MVDNLQIIKAINEVFSKTTLSGANHKALLDLRNELIEQLPPAGDECDHIFNYITRNQWSDCVRCGLKFR